MLGEAGLTSATSPSGAGLFKAKAVSEVEAGREGKMRQVTPEDKIRVILRPVTWRRGRRSKGSKLLCASSRAGVMCRLTRMSSLARMPSLIYVCTSRAGVTCLLARIHVSPRPTS